VPSWFPELEESIEGRAEGQAGRGRRRLARIVTDRVIAKFIRLCERGRAPPNLKEASLLAREMIRNATIDALRSRYATDVDLPAEEPVARVKDPAEIAAEHEAESAAREDEEDDLLRWGRQNISELRLGPLQVRILALPQTLSDDEAARRLGRPPWDFQRSKARLLQKLARLRARRARPSTGSGRRRRR
jgi:hypothetical protein